MNRMNRTIVSMVVLGLCVAGCGGGDATLRAPASAVPTSSARGLDGVSYDVSLEFPGEAPVNDTLRFASGRFESSACTSVGFPQWTTYQSRIDGGSVAFDVITHHPGGGTVAWHGTVKGDAVEGTADRTMEGKLAAGTFKGRASR